MPKTPTTCRRNHPLTGSNVRAQTNTYHPVRGGKPRRYKTKVCVACSRLRAARARAGKPIKDLRKGAR